LIRRREVGEIPQASLADVAFLLFIFFISTASFYVERGIPLKLPGRSSARVRLTAKDVVTIRSDAEGALYLDDRPVALAEIQPILTERLAANEELVVAIESHSESRYEVMVKILDEVKKAKAPRISLKMRRI
jgi:biopolymer transport protein ExbD